MAYRLGLCGTRRQSRARYDVFDMMPKTAGADERGCQEWSFPTHRAHWTGGKAKNATRAKLLFARLLYESACNG